MKILGIDTSGLVATAAVDDDDVLLGEYTIDYKKTHSQTLLPMIDALFTMLEIKVSDIDAIAIAAGPGSFTGLRIGAATVKGFGVVTDAPVIPVPTVDALAFNLWGSSGLVCPVMDARRMQTYTGLYRFDSDGGMETVLAQRAVSLVDIITEINRRGEEVTFLGDGVPVFSDEIAKTLRVPYRFAPAHLARQHAGSVASLGRKLYDAGRYVSCDEFALDYLRMSQAERERMEKEAHVREASLEDAARLSALSDEAMSEPWNEQSFRDRISSDRAKVYILGDFLGYAVVYVTADEAELPQIAVDVSHRGNGYGSRLMKYVIESAAKRGAGSLYLEVRESNEVARRLYESYGMEKCGERKDFYHDPTEAAVLYRKDLKG